MKLNEVFKPLHHTFTVGELTFKADIFEDDHIVFSVYDSGDLKVGEFSASKVGDDIEYSDPMEYNDTIERLRQTGDSSKIAANVRKTLHSAGH